MSDEQKLDDAPHNLIAAQVAMLVNRKGSIGELRDLMRDYYNATLERAAKVAMQRKSYQMQIGCPENKPGCLVYHSVTATRDSTPQEIAADILALKELVS